MNVSLVGISHDGGKLDEVKRLYFEAFPVEERRPWENLMRLVAAEQKYQIDIIKADNCFAGFITSWTFDEFVYIEHFAVLGDRRGAGIGAASLSAFLSRQSLPVVLEVEPRESGELACRRIGFYQRQSFKLCDDFDYLQPPYSEGLPSVKLKLMIYPATVPATTLYLSRVSHQLHRQVYG